MEIRNVTAEQLEAAAQRAHVRLKGGGHWNDSHGYIRPIGQTRQGGRKWRITLATIRDDSGRVVYGRRGFTIRKDGQRSRIPGHVCWHGHRDFMRALFALAPEAVIVSAMARYNGADDFERKFAATAERNVGSMYQPAAYADLCDCEE